MPSSNPPTLAWKDAHALVEQVADYAMFVLDLEGNIASWNRGAQRIKQYKPEEIIGQHFSKFYPPEDLASRKPWRELEEALQTGHVEDEGWRVRKDGSRFWASVSITLLREDDGTPKGFAKVTRDLSERRQTEEALRRAEERFRMLVDSVSDHAFYMLDPEGIVTTWNRGAQQIKGYDAASIIGKSFRVFFSEEDRAAGRPERELSIAASEGKFAEEGWRVRADGSRFWASVVVTPLRSAAGALLGFSKVTRDLTAQRDAEVVSQQLLEQRAARVVAEAGAARASRERESFRMQSEQLELILEGVADGITVQDRNGRLIFANSAAAKLCGLSGREEMLSLEPLELLKRFEMLDEQGNRFPTNALPGRRVLAGEHQASAIMRVRTRDGGPEWWTQIRANSVPGSDGTPELAINVWHDISEQRRRAEHERYLAQVTAVLSTTLDYQATLARLVDSLVPGLCDWCVIHLLEDGELRTAALAHADPRKVKPTEEFQRNYPPHTDDPGGVWQVIRSGEPVLYEHVSEEALLKTARNEEHLAMLKAAPMRSLMFVPIKSRDRSLGAMSLISSSPSRRYDQRDLQLASELGRRVGTFVDNVELYEDARAAAAAAEAAAQEAEAAGRAKDEFLATVSHELRTPLNAILGWAALLRVRSDAASLAKGIDVIHRNASAQSKIIEDILDVSRIITGKLRLEAKPVDLVTIVSDAIEVVRPSAVARDISLRFERPAEPSLLIGDPARLQQVLWNLLSNAVKFNDPGGIVQVAVYQEGSKLEVSVSDNGKGIAPEFLPYVFERFKQADGSSTRRFGGLGLGLAIVRHIVELHGGAVAVESAGAGRGATFRITLPIRAASLLDDAAQSPEPGRPAVAPVVQANLAGLRLLVVDDERDARDLLELILSEAGAEVRTAASASAGLTVLADFAADVIVSDIGMPDEDGYSFMKRVRGMNGRIGTTPSIALTAYARAEDRQRALEMGFSTHLGKPVHPDELVALVARLAQRS